MASHLVSVQSRTPPIRRAARWPRPLSAYLVIHGIWFVSYALLGKGFAYVGFPPLYVGELLLVFAVLALFFSERISALVRTPLGCLMIAFGVWQLLCAAPYLDTYGTDTLRDSAIWGYAVFAWVTAALVLRMPGLMRTVVSQFSRFGRLFLIVGPIAWLATTYMRDSLPHWPGTNISIPSIKGDEYSVHLAGIFALALQGVGLDRWSWISLILIDAMLAMAVRGGMLAFLVAAGFAILLRPRVHHLVFILGVGMLLTGAMAAFDLRLVVPTSGRELSLEQLMHGISSVVGTSERADLEGTKRWRLLWWGDIRDYTIRGPYFWTGKGYGINLADSDGFQVGSRDEPLRSPHNSHLTFLARSGVPGFSLWLALQVTWAAMMLKSYLRARRLQASEWRIVFAWLLVYWLAFTVAAAFDVFLEGPMAGIPFWTILGLGWGGHTLFWAQVERQSTLVGRSVLPHAHG
jgi:hypothetical protein